MDTLTLFLAGGTLIVWGLGSFFGKLSTNRIGDKTMIWDVIGYVIVVSIFSLFYFKDKIFLGDKNGIVLGLIAGIVGGLGLIGFYLLLSRKDASFAVPITAIYPALTTILAIIFLGEKATPMKILGIVLACASLVVLSA